jgi:four helix bundle protein
MHRKFEDIPVWKLSRELCKDIYSAAKSAKFATDRGFVDQITRAVVSVLSNVAEGVERSSTADLINFLFIAKGSSGEVRAQLYVAEDQGYISSDRAAELRAKAETISRQLSAWIQSMQTQDFNPGPRFHKEKSQSELKYEQDRKILEEKLKQKEEERLRN